MEKEETYSFEELCKMSRSRDALVRSDVASYLVNFTSKESKELLIKLAADKDALVRTEALDSLCVFYSEDIEDFLVNAIKSEPDELARCYAILSWADVAFALGHNTPENSAFIEQVMHAEDSQHCRTSCCYAQYIFGNKAKLDEMLTFLNNDDYNIRCSAINLLREFVNSENKEKISTAVRKLLESEPTAAVKDAAERLLAEALGR